MEETEVYRNLAPCLFSSEVNSALEKIRNDRVGLSILFNPKIANDIVESLEKVKSWKDFHKL